MNPRHLLLPPLLAALAGCAAHPHAMATVAAAPSAKVAESDPGMSSVSENDLYLGIVDGLIKQERYDAAIAFLDQYATKRLPTPRYQLLRGQALAGAKHYDDAVASYLLAAKAGLAAEAYNGIGRAEAERQRWPEAATDFRFSAQRDPTNAEYLNNLGYAELQQPGQSALAVADLKKAYELQPGSVLIRNNLILAAAMTADQTQVSTLLGVINDSKERDAVSHFTAQWVSGQGGNPAATGLVSTGKGAIPRNEKAVP